MSSRRAASFMLAFLVASLTAGAAFAGMDRAAKGYDPDRLFVYDAAKPLGIQEKSSRTEGDVVISDITFRSPRGKIVPAYIVAPSTGGPYPAIVFSPGGLADRDVWLNRGIGLAKKGVVVLLHQNAETVQALRSFPTCSAKKDTALVVHDVLIVRRAIDLLVARADVDPKQIVHHGRGFGAFAGAILAAVDLRPKAFVLQSGIGRLSTWAGDSCPGTAADRIAYKNRMRKIDSVRYLPHAPKKPLLLQFGRIPDVFSTADSRSLQRVAKKPKTVKWYAAAGISLNEQAEIDSDRWLAELLGVQAPR